MDRYYLPSYLYDNLSDYQVYIKENYLIFCDNDSCFNVYPRNNYVSSDNYTIDDFTSYVTIDNTKFTNNFLDYPYLHDLIGVLAFFLLLFVYFPYRILNRLLGGHIYV